MAGLPILTEQWEDKPRHKRLKASAASGSCSSAYLPAEIPCAGAFSCFVVEQERAHYKEPALYTPPWGEGISSQWSVPLYGLEDPGCPAGLEGFKFAQCSEPLRLDREACQWGGGSEAGLEYQAAGASEPLRQCDSTPTCIRTGCGESLLESVENCYPLGLLEDHHLAYQMIYKDLADMIGNAASCQEPSLEPPWPATRASSPIAAEVENDSLWSDALSAPRTPAVSECVPVREQDYLEEGQASTAHTPEIQSLAFLAEDPEGGNSAQEDKALEDLTETLLECGEALVADDGHRASEVASRIQQHSTPEGTHLQRLAHYFALALVARLNATGADLYSAIRRRDQQAVVEAEQIYDSKDPTAAVAQHFSTSVILDAVEGAERVHIVDYGISSGHQWHALMQALACRPEGPPRLRITGIELPHAQPGLNPAGTARETGRRLAGFAASLGIPFRYKALACKWESVQSSDLDVRDDEVLAVSCMFRLRNLLDDSVVLSNPRRTVLERISSMRPRVFVTAELSLAANAPFLLTRLRQSIPTFYSFFDALESTLPRDSGSRRLIEEEILGRDILNMIACEGADRIERPEAYHQWHRRLRNAGFQQLPLEDSRFVSTRDMLAGYHDDWTIGRDEGWILTGWKGRVHHAYAAWTPS